MTDEQIDTLIRNIIGGIKDDNALQVLTGPNTSWDIVSIAIDSDETLISLVDGSTERITWSSNGGWQSSWTSPQGFS